MLIAFIAVVVFILARNRAVIPFIIVFAIGSEYLSNVEATSALTIPKVGMATAVAALFFWHRPVWPPRLTVGWPLLFMAAFMATSVMWSQYPSTSLVRLVTLILLCGLYFTVIFYVRDGSDIANIWSAIVAYATIDSAVSLISVLTGNVYLEEASGIRTAGITSNPNQSAYVTGVGLCIVLVARWVSRSSRPWYTRGAIPVGLCVLFIAAILSEASRGGLLATAFGVLAVIWCSSTVEGAWKKIAKNAWVFAGIVVVVCCSMATATSQVKSRFDTSLEDRLGGRVDIYQYFLGRVPEHFFFGHGINSAYYLASDDWGFPLATHNTFLNLLVDFGLMGLLLYLIVLLAIFRALHRLPTRNPALPVTMDAVVLKSICICAFVVSLAGDQIQDKFTWLIIASVDGVVGLFRRHPGTGIGMAPGAKRERGIAHARDNRPQLHSRNRV